MPDDDELAALRRKVEELERRLGIPRRQEMAKQASALAEARKNLFPHRETAASRTFSNRIKALAGRSNLVVEWTARDISAKVGEECGCGCGCGCGCECTCYA